MAKAPGHPIASYQPLRLLVQILHGSTILARFPFWLIQALVPSLRPHRSWTVKQVLMSRVLYAVIAMNSRIGITESITLKPKKEGKRFQVIEAPKGDVFRGPLVTTSVQPGTVGATWFPEAPGKDIGSKIIVLHCHGGAFVLGDGRDDYSGFSGRSLVASGGADAVLSLQYRLSGYGGRDPFPAALQDAVTAYLYLIRELGVPPKQIVLTGDSAGGNLVIALLRYIHEYGGDVDIPAPRCAGLFSPWLSPLNYNVDDNPRAHSDYLPTSFVRWGALAYTAGLDNPASHPYVSHVGNAFQTSVPLFINGGTAEILFDDIEKWAEEMRQIVGNVVELHKEEAALHDTLLLGNVLGFEDSAHQTLRAMRAFVQRY